MPAPIQLHGEEAGAWPVLEYAQRINLDTRIDPEDTLKRPDRIRRATSNEELVRYALRKSGTPALKPGTRCSAVGRVIPLWVRR
jgi:hypothetical protein